MTSSIAQLTRDGWKPTLRDRELLKIYDGYVGVIQVLPPSISQDITWAVWCTGSAPVRSGVRSSLLRAADSTDRAVRKIQRSR